MLGTEYPIGLKKAKKKARYVNCNSWSKNKCFLLSRVLLEVRRYLGFFPQVIEEIFTLTVGRHFLLNILTKKEVATCNKQVKVWIKNQWGKIRIEYKASEYHKVANTSQS